MRRRTVIGLLAVFAGGLLAGQLLSGMLRGAAAPAGPQLTATPASMPAAEPIARAPAEESRDARVEGLSAEERRDIEVFRRASDSVVNVTSVAVRRSFFFDVTQIPRGAGSGFFWDRRGHIVTNYHVVEGANRFVVTLADGSDWDAELIGTAPEKDLAVLQIHASRAKQVPLEPGNSSELLVGQKVFALGNPFGLDQTLTVGVVSAVGREIQSPAGRAIRDVIQTDAAINPGNSGGPLLDSTGRLIGVNTAIFSPSGASAGIGFAIPVDTVRRLVPQLIEHGRPIEAGIAGLHWLSDRQARSFGLEGAVVRDVAPDSPADRAGLEGIGVTRRGRYVLGDVVIAVEGNSVASVDRLRDFLEQAGVGGTVTLTVERDGRRREVRVELRRVG